MRHVPKKLIRRVCVVVVGILSTIATKRLLTLGWMAVTGKKPPQLGRSLQSFLGR